MVGKWHGCADFDDSYSVGNGHDSPILNVFMRNADMTS